MSKSRYIIPLAATMLLSMACDRRPAGVLSEGKTTEVLSDLQVAEAYIQMHGGEYSGIEARRALKLQILKDHGVTEEEFDKTIDWYGHNIDRYSKLYEKVARRIESSKRDMEGTADASVESKDLNSLWPYSQMTMLSELSTSDGIRFSLSPSFSKGDKIEWSMRLSKVANIDVLLGVEYSDGGMSYSQRSFGGSQKVSMKLQTDSTKEVRRLFGSLTVADRTSLPLWIDSIAVRTTPLNSENYSSISFQQTLMAPGKNKEKRLQRIKQDSIAASKKEGSKSNSSISDKAMDAPAGGTPPSAGGFRPGANAVKKL